MTELNDQLLDDYWEALDFLRLAKESVGKLEQQIKEVLAALEACVMYTPHPLEAPEAQKAFRNAIDVIAKAKVEVQE